MASLSPNIGKISGITIQLHWSFLALILFIFILSIAAQELYFFVIIVLLFACVLAHELTHSIVSQRNGVRVKRIVLLPIGGASIIDMEKVKPSVELKIAIAGPFASIALGAVFGALYFIAPHGILQQTMLTLFELNLLLGGFNLLPGFPLDGGRVLRSYLQGRHSFIDATRLAVKASNWTILALMIGTVVYAALVPGASFAYREFIVFWDMIIALFLYDGARAELQSAQLKVHTDLLKAKDMMTANYVVLDKQVKAADLYRLMLNKGAKIALFRHGKSILKADDKELSALIGAKDYVSWREIRARKGIPTVKYNETLTRAIELMRNDEADTLAVTRNGKLAGILYAPYIETALQVYLSKDKTAGNQSSAKSKVINKEHTH